MSARAMIQKVAAERGWTITSMEWEPVRAGGEKSGPEGGWVVEVERDGRSDQALGYNGEQAAQWLRNLDDGWGVDPFSCCGKVASLGPDDCLMARGHRGPHESKRTRGLVAP